MIRGLLTFGLTRRPLVLLGLLVFLGAGLFAFSKLNIEAYPNPAPVILEITAQAPGLSAEEMERYYTIPIEVGLASTPGVDIIRSTSFYGLSFVRVTFYYGIDYYFALTKPFSPPELSLRVRALLRRLGSSPALDQRQQELVLGLREVELLALHRGPTGPWLFGSTPPVTGGEPYRPEQRPDPGARAPRRQSGLVENSRRRRATDPVDPPHPPGGEENDSTSRVSSRRRSSASTSYPLTPEARSRMTMSGRSSRAALEGLGPGAGGGDPEPGLGQMMATRAAMSGSSSTTRMRWVMSVSGAHRRLVGDGSGDPGPGVGAASLRGADPLGPHVGVVLHHRVENGRHQPARGTIRQA